eukprot:GHVR01150599.1.p1 GENE.GHVR01150599.1~~GHVR01150599.1.p1  ORF type:complete len:308 (-),score=47.75 GHVR01150599.1:861-1784(-)
MTYPMTRQRIREMALSREEIRDDSMYYEPSIALRHVATTVETDTEDTSTITGQVEALRFLLDRVTKLESEKAETVLTPLASQDPQQIVEALKVGERMSPFQMFYGLQVRTAKGQRDGLYNNMPLEYKKWFSKHGYEKEQERNVERGERPHSISMPVDNVNVILKYLSVCIGLAAQWERIYDRTWCSSGTQASLMDGVVNAMTKDEIFDNKILEGKLNSFGMKDSIVIKKTGTQPAGRGNPAGGASNSNNNNNNNSGFSVSKNYRGNDPKPPEVVRQQYSNNNNNNNSNQDNRRNSTAFRGAPPTGQG